MSERRLSDRSLAGSKGEIIVMRSSRISEVNLGSLGEISSAQVLNSSSVPSMINLYRLQLESDRHLRSEGKIVRLDESRVRPTIFVWSFRSRLHERCAYWIFRAITLFASTVPLYVETPKLWKEYPELVSMLTDPPQLVGKRVRFIVVVKD